MLITHTNFGKHLSQNAFSRRRESNGENPEPSGDKASREALETCHIPWVRLPWGGPSFSRCVPLTSVGAPATGHVVTSPLGGSGITFLSPQDTSPPPQPSGFIGCK